MEKFVISLQREVESRLDGIKRKQTGVMERAWEGICYLETTFAKLKGFVTEHDFTDENREIVFFKEVKPRMVSYLLYCRKIYNLELNRPAGSHEVLSNYWRTELDGIKIFFDRNTSFYQYLRSGATHMDRNYFLRNGYDPAMNPDCFYFERDPRFSTGCDFKVAKILANEMIERYLKMEMHKFDHPDSTQCNVLAAHSWTRRKNDLIELIYALDTDASVDDGTLSLTQLTNFFESMFNIDLGNVPRYFTDMRIRNNPTPFLDRLRDKILERMGREDEKNK